MARTEVGERTSESAKHLHYRPHLDGLRTVAVYLVVAFHARLGVFSGGFIGVDIFYVLSGFLVTSILLRDLRSVGRVDYRRFYSRRVRRILPAAFATLLITAVAWAAIATPSEMLDALGGFRAAFLYVANWFFIRQATDYFAADVNSNPVLHFWSLAIEEQFYLLWPLLLSGVYVVACRAGRRRWWVVRGIIATAAVASAIAALRLGSTNLVRAYYGTDTRAYQLLAGALLALTPQLLHLKPRAAGRLLQWSAPFVLGTLIVLGTSMFDIGPITRGALVALLVPLLIAALENARGGTAKRVLSSAPFTYLGRVSYGTYLWHWPVIVLATHERRIDPVPLFLIACPLATLLAILSFHLLEHPIRSSRALERYKVPVVAFGFSASILAGLLVVPMILDSGGSGASSATRLLDWRAAKKDIPDLPDCLGRPLKGCTLVHGSGAHVLLMGDSNARMWIPTLVAAAERESLTLSVAVYPTCPWQADLQYAIREDIRRSCAAHRNDWYGRVIPQLDPDVIFLVHQAYDDPARPGPMVGRDGRTVGGRDAAFEPTLIDASASALRRLERPGRKIVIIEPIPLTRGGIDGFDPLSCISEGSPSKCAYQANLHPTPLEQYYRHTGLKSVYSLDLDRWVCPRWPTCDAIVGNIIVKRDVSHLTATFARSLYPRLVTLLQDDGILKRP